MLEVFTLAAFLNRVPPVLFIGPGGPAFDEPLKIGSLDPDELPDLEGLKPRGAETSVCRRPGDLQDPHQIFDIQIFFQFFLLFKYIYISIDII
jgi:hypothetical protein